MPLINATAALCCRSVSGVDVDPDLVHMEMQDMSGGTLTFHLPVYHSHIYSWERSGQICVLLNGPALFGGSPRNKHADLSAFFCHTHNTDSLQSNRVFQAVTWRTSTFLVLFLRTGYLTRVFNYVVRVYFLNSFRNASVKFLKLVSSQILKTIEQILEARLRIGPICTILPSCSEKTLKIYIVLGVDMHCSCGNCQEILHLRIIHNNHHLFYFEVCLSCCQCL